MKKDEYKHKRIDVIPGNNIELTDVQEALGL